MCEVCDNWDKMTIREIDMAISEILEDLSSEHLRELIERWEKEAIDYERDFK